MNHIIWVSFSTHYRMHFNRNWNFLVGNTTNEADLHDIDCMSPLYATPPHSPSSELSSPGQLPILLNNHEEIGNGATGTASSVVPITPIPNGSIATGKSSAKADNHFARDTHMRIILGNLKENQASSSSR